MAYSQWYLLMPEDVPTALTWLVAFAEAHNAQGRYIRLHLCCILDLSLANVHEDSMKSTTGGFS